MTHPCQYSPEVIEALRPLIKPGEWIHDPFAGTGLRLAALCDQLGAIYTGCDIEEWPAADTRVMLSDATTANAYPGTAYTIVTSPAYLNKRLCDYPEGPLETTKTKGRRDYGIALGRPLHERNLARHTGRASRAAAYWRLHADCVRWWGDRALVNVDQPIADGWAVLLMGAGYRIEQTIPVYTRRDRSQQHTVGYAEHEVVIVARKGTDG